MDSGLEALDFGFGESLKCPSFGDARVLELYSYLQIVRPLLKKRRDSRDERIPSLDYVPSNCISGRDRTVS